MTRSAAKKSAAPRATGRVVPTDVDTVEMRAGSRSVHLTNLRKPFWPELGISKGDLLQYYVDVSPVLLPHLHDRAMRERALRRLPVVDERGTVVGIVSLGDLAVERDPRSALADISAAPPNV